MLVTNNQSPQVPKPFILLVDGTTHFRSQVRKLPFSYENTTRNCRVIDERPKEVIRLSEVAYFQSQDLLSFMGIIQVCLSTMDVVPIIGIKLKK